MRSRTFSPTAESNSIAWDSDTGCQVWIREASIGRAPLRTARTMIGVVSTVQICSVSSTGWTRAAQTDRSYTAMPVTRQRSFFPMPPTLSRIACVAGRGEIITLFAMYFKSVLSVTDVGRSVEIKRVESA